MVPTGRHELVECDAAEADGRASFDVSAIAYLSGLTAAALNAQPLPAHRTWSTPGFDHRRFVPVTGISATAHAPEAAR
jgi:hypothetical protein